MPKPFVDTMSAENSSNLVFPPIDQTYTIEGRQVSSSAPQEPLSSPHPFPRHGEEHSSFAGVIISYLLLNCAGLVNTKTVVVLQHLLSVSEKYEDWITLSKWLRCCQSMGLQQHVTLLETTRLRLLGNYSSKKAVDSTGLVPAQPGAATYMKTAASTSVAAAGTANYDRQNKLPPKASMKQEKSKSFSFHAQKNSANEEPAVPLYIQEGVSTFMPYFLFENFVGLK